MIDNNERMERELKRLELMFKATTFIEQVIFDGIPSDDRYAICATLIHNTAEMVGDDHKEILRILLNANDNFCE